MVVPWNSSRHRRCPACDTLVDTGKRPTWRAVYECCRCRIRFSQWPLLAPLLPVRTCKDLPSGECPHFGKAGQRDG